MFIVGTGQNYIILKNFVKIKKLSIIKFLGPIKHNKINHIYDISDIFVSLNTTGNFSNNCLEAFNSGNCCIIPEVNENNGCDKIISKYLKKDSLIRVPFENMCENLTKILANLLIIKKKKFTQIISKEILINFLISWDIRIQKELSLIDKLIDQIK